MKIKASALYIAIIIALVIAVICSSLIVSAYFFKAQYQRKFRYDHLQNNMRSGVNIMLGGDDESYSAKKIGLFTADQDSIILKRRFWGLYDVAIVQPCIQRDTLTALFSIANQVDSAKWAALYLIDEDRPLSVSGNTEISGNAFIPKAGVKEAYVDNNAYTGDKRMVSGIKKISEKELPPLAAKRLSDLQALFIQKPTSDTLFYKDANVSNSFNSDLKVVGISKKTITLSNNLNGYIMVRSDTTITLDSSARLNNVIIYAPSIQVKEGFKGVCQLYAADSIHIERNCHFEYPSVISLTRFNSSKNKAPGKIVLDNGVIVNGTIFTYEKEKPKILPAIVTGDNVTVTGQIYSQGILNYKKNFRVQGSVFTSRFIYQSSYTRYENYLISANLNSRKLSKYYLTSDLLPVASKNKQVLQWLK